MRDPLRCRQGPSFESDIFFRISHGLTKALVSFFGRLRILIMTNGFSIQRSTSVSIFVGAITSAMAGISRFSITRKR